MSNENIVIKGAKENNLKNLNVDLPLGVFTCITGVSGSGKSSLLSEIIYPHLFLNTIKTLLLRADFLCLNKNPT